MAEVPGNADRGRPQYTFIEDNKLQHGKSCYGNYDEQRYMSELSTYTYRDKKRDDSYID